MKNKLSLYDISQEFSALSDLLTMEAGEVTEDFEALEKECAELMESKVDGFVSYIEMLKGEIELADLRIKKAQEFKSARKNAIIRLERLAIESLTNANAKEFRGELGQIKLRKPAKVLSIEVEDNIPVQYLKQIPATVTVDKVALKKAIKNGEYSGEAARLVDGEQKVILSLKSL